MTAEPMTDLAERVALALGWTWGEQGCDKAHEEYAHSRPHWWHDDGCEEGLPKLDWSIVPMVVEAIREREWCCEWAFDKAGGVARIYLKDETWVVFREDPDPVVALCEAFVAAVEALPR